MPTDAPEFVNALREALNELLAKNHKAHHLIYTWRDSESDNPNEDLFACSCDNKVTYKRAEFNDHQLESLAF